MSVINQMLRDLDKRGAGRGGDAAANFAANRQVVEARRLGSEWFWRVSAVLAMIAVGWVTWIIWELRPRSLVMEVALRTPISRPSPSDASGGEVKSVAEMSNRAAANTDNLPGDTAPARVEIRAAEKIAGMRLATEITRPVGAGEHAAIRPERETRAVGSVVVSVAAPQSAPDKPVAQPAARAPSAARAQAVAQRPGAGVESRITSAEPRIEKREAGNATERAEAEYRAALASLGQGRVALAAEGLRRAVALDPAHEGARQALAGHYLQERRLESAAAVLSEGLALNPRNQTFAMTLARVTVERGDTASALAVLERHAGADINADYRAFRAAMRQRLGRHRDAAEDYRLALAQSPGMAQWWVGLGISQQAQARPKEALESFSRAKQTGNLSPELLSFVDQRLQQLQP